jgi:hypothetical protein
MDAVCDEMKYRSTRHHDRRPRIMGQHEYRCMEGRVFAPPTRPGFVQPRPPNGTEHVTAENAGPDAGKTPRREVVIDARLASLLPMNPPKGPGGEKPFMQRQATNAQGILAVLVRPGAVAVK